MSALLMLVASMLFRLHDARIDEASGIAHGLRSPDTYYVHNDSGDSARFFAIDRSTGRTRAVYAVPGARNVDWEDVAVAPDARGTPSVWLADIGDNHLRRDTLTMYRVDEPRVPHRATTATLTTAPADVWRLRYPDGPHDAEALLVDPTTHRAFIVTKTLTGRSAVYALPPGARGGAVQPLRKVAIVTIPGLINGPRQLAITGGDIAADGHRLVLRTYTDAYVWPLHDGAVAAAVGKNPELVALPDQVQGEGVTVDGNRLVVDSEGAGTTVYAVALPATATATAEPSPRTAVRPPDEGRGMSAPLLAAAGAAAVLAAAAGAYVRRVCGRRR